MTVVLTFQMYKIKQKNKAKGNNFKSNYCIKANKPFLRRGRENSQLYCHHVEATENNDKAAWIWSTFSPTVVKVRRD